MVYIDPRIKNTVLSDIIRRKDSFTLLDVTNSVKCKLSDMNIDTKVETDLENYIQRKLNNLLDYRVVEKDGIYYNNI